MPESRNSCRSAACSAYPVTNSTRRLGRLRVLSLPASFAGLVRADVHIRPADTQISCERLGADAPGVRLVHGLSVPPDRPPGRDGCLPT